MSIKPLVPHYAFENPASVYDEEALTALELAARTSAKVNECVEEVNTIPDRVRSETLQHIEGGTFDKQIDEHTKELTTELQETTAYLEDRLTAYTQETNARLGNLAKLEEGSTTGDAELTDARIGFDGSINATAGDAIRNQALEYTPTVTLYNYYLSVDTDNKTVNINGGASGTYLYGIHRRNRVNLIYTTPEPAEALSYDDINQPVGVWLGTADPNNAVLFLKSARSDGFQPAPTDILLAIIYTTKVIPVYLSPVNIIVNGKYLLDMPTFARNNTTTRLLFLLGKLMVDPANKTVTIPEGSILGMPFYNPGGIAVPMTVSTTYNVNGVVEYLVMDADTLELTIQDRFHVAKEYEFILGCFLNGEFTPIEVMPEHVHVVGATPEVTPGTSTGTGEHFTTIAEFLAPLADWSKTTKIVLLGDSITMGAGGTGYAQDGDPIQTSTISYKRNPNGICWANTFARYIADNYNATVLNNAISGYSSTLLNDNKEYLIPADTDLVICMIGTNDRFWPSSATSGVTAKTMANLFRNNLMEIVNYAHSLGVPVLLLNCIPTTLEDQNKDGRLLNIEQVNAVIRAVANDFNMEMADVHTNFTMVMNQMTSGGDPYTACIPDGIHPNDYGHLYVFLGALMACGLNYHGGKCNAYLMGG